MPAITLPDGSVRHFDGAVTGTEIAALAHEFNTLFNRGSVKHGRRFWSEQQY